MKRRDLRLFLWDIDDACNVIDELTAGRTLQDYGQNVAARFAIERAFEIIGEAMRNLLEQRPELADRFTNPAYIISFRNRIATSTGESSAGSYGPPSTMTSPSSAAK